MSYDYRQAMVNDIKNYIIDNYMEPQPDMTRDDYIETLNYELWDVDEITGNGAYYYASEDECAGYIGYGITELIETLEEYGYEFTNNMRERLKREPARFIDCLIRCHLLYECVEQAVNELGYKWEE